LIQWYLQDEKTLKTNLPVEKYQMDFFFYKEKYEECLKILEIAKPTRETLEMRINCHLELGDYQSALESLPPYISLDLKDAGVFDVCSIVYFKNQMYQQSFDYCEKYLELRPSDYVIYWRMGDIQRIIGDKEQADVWYTKAYNLVSKTSIPESSFTRRKISQDVQALATLLEKRE
jgi:tetratricopeptide (TPR) repeat protein